MKHKNQTIKKIKLALTFTLFAFANLNNATAQWSSNPSVNTPIANTISTYAYDHVDRLTNNVTASTNTGYAYDLSGNRTYLTIGANNYSYSIAASSNRLTAEAGPAARTNSGDINPIAYICSGCFG